MKLLLVITGAVALLLGLAILIFGDGMRRYYSGLFFVAMGLLVLGRARRAGIEKPDV
jgi:predicted membrane channel-forming protein YqfA (hemolysin III family)